MSTSKFTTTKTSNEVAGVHTRKMTKKIVVNAAAASLRAAKVPTKGRMFSASSIAAAATAIVTSNSPQNKGKEGTPTTRIMSPVKMATNTTSVMTIGAGSVEEQLLEMRIMLEQVLKDNEEKKQRIEDLQKEVSGLRGEGNLEETNPIVTAEDNHATRDIIANAARNENGAYDEQQLQRMIINAVRSQLIGDTSGGVRYTKPYTRRIDNLRMPVGYQPPKFQQFDGKGNPKQHIAHFVETCNNAGTEGDLLVKQFVRSLKGIAFDWYTDLDAETIDSWEGLEDEFLNRFYSTRRVVSMSELTNTRQWEDEPVVDYINRWRALSLECKDRISETSAVEMCIDGMK